MNRLEYAGRWETRPLSRWFCGISGSTKVFLVVVMLLLASSPLGAQAPIVGRISLTIDDVVIASFAELAEISSTTQHVSRLTGVRLARPTVECIAVMRRVMTSGDELWTWYQSVISGFGGPQGKNAALVIHDRTGAPIVVFNLENAWPSKIEIGSLEMASDSAPLTETVTLTCERITRVAP